MDFRKLRNLETLFTQADIIPDAYTRYHKIQSQIFLRYIVSEGWEGTFETNLTRGRCWNQVLGCLIFAKLKYDCIMEFIHQNMALNVYRISRMHAYGSGICLLMKGMETKLWFKKNLFRAQRNRELQLTSSWRKVSRYIAHSTRKGFERRSRSSRRYCPGRIFLRSEQYSRTTWTSNDIPSIWCPSSSPFNLQTGLTHAKRNAQSCAKCKIVILTHCFQSNGPKKSAVITISSIWP